MVWAMAFVAERALELLKKADEHGRLPHALLVCGAKGSGKERLVAGLMAHFHPGEAEDMFGEATVVPVTIEEAENEWVRVIRPRKKSRMIGVDDVRDLEHLLQMSSPVGTMKIAVVEHADRMNVAAANAFLKTLEEPPRDSLLVLMTENPQVLLPTILSRCIRISLVGGDALRVEGAEVLLREVERVVKAGLGDAVQALRVKVVFQKLLDEKKERTLQEVKESLKEDKGKYGQSVDKEWMKEREEDLDAVARAVYLDYRSRLIEVLMAVVADLLRAKMGGGNFDFPEFRDSYREIVERGGDDFEGRLRGLEEMRKQLETNVHEQICLDVGFLRAFG